MECVTNSAMWLTVATTREIATLIRYLTPLTAQKTADGMKSETTNVMKAAWREIASTIKGIAMMSTNSNALKAARGSS